MITVGDIPSISGLEAITLRTHSRLADKIIRWPYIAEEHDLAPWLVGGEVIFITGINRSWSDEGFVHLLKVAADKNAAAVVVLTGSNHIKELKNSWVRYAEQAQMALLEQPYSLPMVTVTERLSNAIIQSTFAARSKQWFLMQMIENPESPEPITLAQAGDIGLPTQNRLALAMVLPCDKSRHNLESWQFALREFLNRCQSPFPLIEYRAGWLLCVPENDQLPDVRDLSLWQQLHQQLQQAGMNSSIGLSDAPSLAKLNKLVFQARQCSEFIHRHFRGQLFHHTTFGLQRLFAAIDDPLALSEFCQQTLGPLHHSQQSDHQQIKLTLEHYFNNLGSLRGTALQMGIHRNTVSGRIQKFEQLTQLSLDDANHRLAIQNALMIERFIQPAQKP